MMNNGRSNSYNSTYPFTQTQWQELENQALIYKYMASGIPIPSDLLLPIKRSFYQNPSSPFMQPTMGWNCYQIGYGRKAEDPEPGRCRRTDGKKWRCSKEAYPDSKYCERHMHRGKNRSRKPVEISLASSTSVANISVANSSVVDCHVVNDSSSSSSSFCNNIDQFRYPNPLLYSHPYQSQNNTASNFGLDSGSFSSSTERDYRYYQGMKDEYGYMADTNGGDRGSSWELRPLGLGEPRLDVDDNKNKHCFVLGADFKQEKPVKERDFFDLDWPQKSNKGTWMGLEEDNNNSNQAPNSIYSKTNLSISIPMGLHDFPQWFVSLCSFMLNFMCVKLNTCSSN